MLKLISYVNFIILGNHEHTYLHNVINDSCFQTTVVYASRKDCHPAPVRSAEACYACCDVLCPGDDNCKHDTTGVPSCDAWH